MAITKEVVEQEKSRVASGITGEIHLWREGTFLRAYEWSAWLCCSNLHGFKVNKRQFEDIEEPVAYIGFPETSLSKWVPEGVEVTAEDEKHLLLRLPEEMLTEPPENMSEEFAAWKEAVPLTESSQGQRKKGSSRHGDAELALPPTTLTALMQRVLAWPIESKSPMESMVFLADIKRQLAQII